MNCSVCGAALEADSRFCQACGAAVEEPLPAPKDFWMAPSADLEHPLVSAQPPEAPPKPSARPDGVRPDGPVQDARPLRRVLLICGLVLLLTTGLLLFFALRGRDAGQPETRSAQQTAEDFAVLWAERDLIGCGEYLAYPVQDTLLTLYRERGYFGPVTDSEAQRENTRRRMEESHREMTGELQREFGERYEITAKAELQTSYTGDELASKLKHYRSSKLDPEIYLPDWVAYDRITEMQIFRAQTSVTGNRKTRTNDLMICLVLIDGAWKVLW